MSFLECAHNLWDAANPTIVLTDNKSNTRFFQTKAIPPALWNSYDYALQFNFKIAYIAGSVNTAAVFVCRLQLKVTERIRHKVQKDIQPTLIEVKTSPSDVADQDQIFFFPGNNKNESEEQTLERKKQSRQHAKQWVAKEEPSLSKTSVEEITLIDVNTASFYLNGTKANAQTLVEQDVDLLSIILILNFLGQPNDEVILTTDPC